MEQSTSAAGLRYSNSQAEIASLVAQQKQGMSTADITAVTSNLQVMEKAELNESSDNNEDEMLSKRLRKVIIPDPQTPVEPAKCKLTATQKKREDEERVVKKAEEEKAKEEKKVAYKAAKEEKREAAHREKERKKEERAEKSEKKVRLKEAKEKAKIDKKNKRAAPSAVQESAKIDEC